MLPSATDLQYFVEVARTLNISRASERIGITQPTLTQSVQKLEACVGTPLLIRTRAGVRLTKAGQRVSSRVQEILEMWETIATEAKRDTTELQGRFRFGAHPSVARYMLPGLFAELTKRAPGLEIELEHDLSRRITESVINFRIDLAYVINPVEHPDLVLKKVTDDVVTVFESEQGRQGDLLFGDPDLIQTQWVLKRIKKSPLTYSHFVPTANLEVVHRLVASGAGFGILPTLVSRCEPGVKLRAVNGQPQFRDELFVAYRKDVMSSRAAKLLVEIAKSVRP